MRIIAFFVAIGVYAAPPNNLVIATSATQAKLTFTSTCNATATVVLSESKTLSPVVNDLNLTYFPTANTTGILSTTAVGGGLYLTEFAIGHRDATTAAGTNGIKSRALAAGTPHYGSVTCSGETTLFGATTQALSGLVPEAPPWNSDGRGNSAVEPFDFTDKTKPVIDPQTGAKVYRVSNSTDRGFVRPDTFQAGSVFGASGWTTPQNLVNATKAITGNTNDAFVPFMSDGSRTYAGFAISDALYSFQLSNVGIVLIGSATNTTGTNADVEVCLSVDSGQNCYTDRITFTLTGSVTTLPTLPTTYAQNGFTGWSKTIPAELRMNQGYVTMSGSTVTVVGGLNSSTSLAGAQSATAWARPNWTAGTRIFVTGAQSAGCASDYLTLVSVTNKTTFTVSESCTIASPALYRSQGFGIMVRKKTATGTVTIQVTYVDAGYSIFQQGQNISCSSVQVTSTVDKNGAVADTPGHLCMFNEMRDAFTGLWFVGNDPGDFRPLSQLAPPSTIPGYGADDLPTGASFRRGPTSAGLVFSPSDGNKFYTVNTTTAAGNPQALWELAYSGNYTTPANFPNSFRVDGLISGYTDPVTWTNLTRPSQAGRSLSAQITANTTYDPALFGAFSSLTLDGVASGFAILRLTQLQNFAGSAFMFALATGDYSSYYNTLQTAAGAKFGGLHNVTPVPGDSNKGVNSYHQLRQGSAAVFAGGPYLTLIDCVYKSGVCAANTSVTGTIPVPGAGQSGTYDSACPSDVPQIYKTMGATDNQCVTVEIIGEPCSLTPSSAELAAYPCPNPSSTGQSWIGVQSQIGDAMTDSTGDEDVEWWLLVIKGPTTVTTCAAGGRCKLVFMRDSTTGYNCVENVLAPGSQLGTRGRSCVNSVGQATHANGWSGRWIPSNLYPIYNPTTQTFEWENLWLTRAHSDRIISSTGVNTFVGVTLNGYAARVGGVIGGNPTANFVQYPGFAGVLASAGGANWIQSYPTTQAPDAVGIDTQVDSDFRIVARGACEAEAPECSIGDIQGIHLEAGTTSVYRISQINGSYDPKKTQIMAWAGSYLLKEKSSVTTGNTLTDADTWKICYAINANECRTGSTAGQTFIVAPQAEIGSSSVVNTAGTVVTRVSGTAFNATDQSDGSLIKINDVTYTVFLFTDGDHITLYTSAGTQSGKVAQWNTPCVQGQISFRSVCVFAASSILGKATQMQLIDDPEGIYQRRVTDMFTRPGAQYSYTHARLMPNGKCILSTAYQLDNWWSGVVQVCPGPYIQDSANRTTFQPVRVQFSAASWYVKFGLDANFYCAPRAEACKTADSTINATTPFSWNSESMTPVSGSGTVTFPALPGRIYAYAVVANGVQGATRWVAVP